MINNDENVTSTRLGLLKIDGVLDENGNYNSNRRKLKAKCDCGNEIVISSWDFVLKTKNSCGCRKTVELENKILNALENRHLQYLLDFETRERDGTPIIFNIFVPVQYGKIIMYDQDESWNTKGSSKGLRNTWEKLRDRDIKVKALCDSFGMDVVFIKYEDEERVDEIIEDFLKES